MTRPDEFLVAVEGQVERVERTQRATMNILEDFDGERQRFEEALRATVNILEDLLAEKQRLENAQRAAVNILDDFEGEQRRMVDAQRGTMNVLDDFVAEKARLEDAQRATLNILDDFEGERAKVNDANRDLEAARSALARHAEDLMRSNAELEAFAYSISHDLRAPLRSLDGFSRILAEEHAADLKPEAKKYLGHLVASAGEMGRLIDDLLRFSRVGRQSLRREPLSAKEVMQRVLDDLRPEWSGRDLTVDVQELPPCNADAALLKQVFANLLGNALKYTRKRTPARIEVGFAADSRAYFVRDNGVGFDMKHADKLFGVFQRLHRAEDYEGTGVGLAICHRVVQRHGGKIWADAAPERGATFYFTIPGGNADG